MEKKRVARNGIPVYSYINPNTHGFFVALYLRSGSMFESEEESGITHFLEHAAIRNVNHLMGGETYALLDRYGLEFNAATYSEMVQFYVSGASGSFAVGGEIIAKLLSPITLSREELDAERGRIRAEIREGNDRTSLATFTSERVFEGTSLARSITGTGSSVSRITRKRLEDYRRRVFVADNLYFYVTGNVSDEELDSFCELVGGYELAEKGEIHENVAPVPRNFGKRDAAVYLKNADFTKVKFTFDMDMSRISLPECDLIYDILLGGYSSELFIELSEKRGLFYDLSGSEERYLNLGTLGFSYVLRAQRLYEAIEMTVELLRRLKEKPLAKQRCMYAANVDNAYMLLDEPRELNFTLAYDNYMMSMGYGSIEDRRRAYSEVTPERICEVMRELFRPENLTLTVKGDKSRVDTSRIREIIMKL